MFLLSENRILVLPDVRCGDSHGGRPTRSGRGGPGRLERGLRRRRASQILPATVVLDRDSAHDSEGATQDPTDQQPPEQPHFRTRPGSTHRQDPPQSTRLSDQLLIAHCAAGKIFGRLVTLSAHVFIWGLILRRALNQI